MSTKIEMRQIREKELLLEQFKKIPVIQIACEKLGVARATYYRWRNEDKDFAKKADEALSEGNLLVNDLAESQLMSAIKDKNMTAIMFWLRNHHPAYANKVEVTGQLKQEYKLNETEEALIAKALVMMTQNHGEAR